MPESPQNKSQSKPFAVAVLRIGSHPLVYSVIFIIGAGALAFFLAIVPMVHMLQSGGSASLRDAQDRNRVAQNTLNAQKKLAESVSVVSSDDQALLAYALPSEPDAPGLAIILQGLVNKSAVKMSSFDISEQAAEAEGATALAAGKVALSLSLDLVSYDRLKIVLANIENSLRIFDVQSYSYSPSTGSVTISFTSYYLKST